MNNNIEWQAEQLGLKRMGREYKGPCPVCGGNDRFHLKEVDISQCFIIAAKAVNLLR